MFKIGDDFYYLDIDKMQDWIFHNENDEATFKTETIFQAQQPQSSGKKQSKDTQYGEAVPVQSTAFEEEPKEQYANVRYDILKEMLVTIYNAGVESDGGGKIEYTQDPEDLSIGAKLVLNTFTKKGFLVDKLTEISNLEKEYPELDDDDELDEETPTKE